MIVALLLLIMKPDKTASDTWNVTFESPDYCLLKGSSVEFACSYHYADGEVVESTAWYKGHHKDGKWTRVKLSDIPSYENRSEYLGDLRHNCGLAIHNLQDADTGYYYFRFDTDRFGRRSKDSVYLTVTELNATVSPRRVRAGDRVTLECKTSCQSHRIVWLKDGRPVTKLNFQAQLEDSGSYVCTIEGQEVLSDAMTLDVLYSPLNVSIEVSHTGLLTIGSSANLTCISAGNPAPYDYEWYKGTVSSSMLPVGSGQVLSIPTLETSHGGLYLCQARNHLGGSNSSEVRLSLETDSTRLIFSIGFGVKIVMVLLLSVVIIWVWRQWRVCSADREVRRRRSTSEEDYYDYVRERDG